MIPIGAAFSTADLFFCLFMNNTHTWAHTHTHTRMRTRAFRSVVCLCVSVLVCEGENKRRSLVHCLCELFTSRCFRPRCARALSPGVCGGISRTFVTFMVAAKQPKVTAVCLLLSTAIHRQSFPDSAVNGSTSCCCRKHNKQERTFGKAHVLC